MTRIKDASTTATSPASDDYILLDGATNGSRKMLGMKYHRGALVTKSANQTAANYTTATAVSWNTEAYDTDSIHDNVTNNTRLTVPSGVSYVRLTGQIEISSISAGSTVNLIIRKNGATSHTGVSFTTSVQSAATDFGVPVVSPALAVTGGDYFELYLTVITDTSVDIIAGASWFAMEILG